ncbi:MAG: DUF6483 family protein [Pseudomonadota bacterium]
MLRDDYILRMIQQFAGFIAQLLSRIKSGEVEKTQQEIQAASLNYLGLDLETLLESSNGELLDFFASDDSPDMSKAFMAAHLVFADGRLCEMRKESSNAAARYVKSLDLLLACFEHLDSALQVDARGRIDEIVPRLSGIDLPSGPIKKLMLYYEKAGRYSLAEDRLFELVDLEAEGALELGKSFYERLMEKSDSDLENGNLPRSEACEGLAELEDRLGE